MAATLLPDASHALNWVIRCGIHCRPGRAAIVGGGDECVPFAGETYRLVVACDVSAGEAHCRSPGAATYRFNFGCVLDAMGRPDIKVVSPGDSVIRIAVTDRHARMSFGRIARGYRLIVDVGVVNGAIAIDRNRRIRALYLRNGIRHDEFLPGYAAVRTHRATLVATTVTYRQPDGAIRSHMNVAVQTMALSNTVAFIC